MSKRNLIKLGLSSLVCVALAQCASATPSVNNANNTNQQPDATVVSTASDATASATDAATAPSDPIAAAWAQMTPERLREIVRDTARTRLREYVPTFDIERLSAYVSSPDSAPELPGRAVEELIHLATVALAEGRNDDVQGYIRLARAKARNRNTAFIANSLMAEARRRAAGAEATAQQQAIEATFREVPATRFSQTVVVYQLYQRPEQIRARIASAQRAMVSPETAADVLYYTAVLTDIVANRERYLAAIESVRRANEQAPRRTDYRFSTVDLTRVRDARPVNIAVWDTGTNPALFQQQMFTNTAEQPNGQDDDHNGQVDDIHGIVSDGTAANTVLLFDPGAATIERYGRYLRGVMDLRAGNSSSQAAQQVLELVRGITEEQQQRELDHNLAAIGEWAHGTHVAGIMTAQIPQARLAVFRSAWAGEERVYEDRGPTDEEIEVEHANMQAIAEFINRHQIRVVNASLGFSKDYLEEALRHQANVYHNDDEVRARARAVHERRRGFWREVFERCPNTLFVVAAGNSNRDVVEYDDIPASLDAPNLVVIGAVDRFGDWALFTNSNPERVRLFDLGVEVDSVIPNGERTPLSGTSMASPNAANAAAKMLSVNGSLSPADVIRLLTETADPIAAPFNGRIINEQNAINGARRAPRARTTPPRQR